MTIIIAHYHIVYAHFDLTQYTLHVCNIHYVILSNVESYMEFIKYASNQDGQYFVRIKRT